MTAHELLTDLRSQGFTLRPLPGDKLEVRPANKLTDDLRATLKQRKSEILTLLFQQLPFSCPSCGGVVRLDPADEHAPTRFWTCNGCGAWGATREGAAWPVVWVSPGTVQ